MKTTLATIIVILFSISLASAVIIDSVETPALAPGEEGTIRIIVENILSQDVEDVSLRLDFSGLPFIPLDTSEDSIDELDEDEDESFLFRIKASSNAIPEDYEIPYTLEYILDDETKSKEGTIGIKIRANPELSYSIETENPVQNSRGQLSLKIVNKGFSEAKFVSVKVLPSGFTLLSDDQVYIGEVDSDDFETATFDVLFKTQNPRFTAIVEYKDFDNKKIVENVNIPVTVYTKEKAIELGLIQKSNTSQTIIGIVILLVLFFIWRSVRKRRRAKRSMQR